MTDAYKQALWESTHPPTLTQSRDERTDVPPIQEADRARYQKWLESSGFPAASNPAMWEAICTNWVSFLSATSFKPKAALAPCRKVIRWGPRELESPDDEAKRFKQDRRTRRCIQAAGWLALDQLEVLAERWPAVFRTMVNQGGLPSETGPFESWAAKINLAKRRRGNSVLLGLVCFLVYSYEAGTLEEMGLHLSEDMQDSILDVMQAEMYFGPINQSIEREDGPMEAAVVRLLGELITDAHATFQTNALLWWVGILVQSSLHGGPDDYISRGQFTFNVLTMDMDIKERLEAILHYAKVIVLDHAMHTWEVDVGYVDEVHLSMASLDVEWINADSDERPRVETERRRCESIAWESLSKHVEAQRQVILGDRGKTVVKEV
ncbi:hypothetical protein F5884DRAFT_120041 [Xylogone sp. PMI_703]|nr:hypothetical protein F5884DRAFT_120041 [Xylogone sp. PMI_703]